MIVSNRRQIDTNQGNIIYQTFVIKVCILFRDNKHLSNFSQNGHLSGLGVLIRAYKSVIYPRINGPRSHQQPQREPWQNRRHSSQQGGRRFWNSTSSNSVQQRGFPQRRAYSKPNYRDSQYTDFTGAQQPTSSQHNDYSGAQQPFSQPRTYMYNSNRTADIEDPTIPPSGIPAAIRATGPKNSTQGSMTMAMANIRY